MKCDPARRGETVAALTAHAKYLWNNVNEALSYLVAVDKEDPPSLVLFERYPSEAIAKTLWSLESSQCALNQVGIFQVSLFF